MNYYEINEDTARVALRKESVDRNKPGSKKCPSTYKVALRKESVDRNRNSPICASNR